MSNGVQLAANMPTDRTRHHDAAAYGMGRGTIIPAAISDEKDGRSTGVDHNKPYRVIVDPDQPGAFELNMAELTDPLIKQAVSNEIDLSERLRLIKQNLDNKNRVEQVEQAPMPQPTPSLNFPTKSVFSPQSTLQASVTPAFVPNTMENAPQLFRIHTPESLPWSLEMGTVPQTFSVAPPTLSPREVDLIKQIDTIRQNYDKLYHHCNTVLQQKDELSKRYDKLKEDYVELGNAYEQAINAIKTNSVTPVLPQTEAIASSVLPFLSDVARPPKSKAVFNFKQIGVMSALYHKLIVTEANVVLVYDTRFEYGTQYIPPQLNDEDGIAVTLIDEEGTKNMQLRSLGINFSLGCLDISVLFRV